MSAGTLVEHTWCSTTLPYMSLSCLACWCRPATKMWGHLNHFKRMSRFNDQCAYGLTLYQHRKCISKYRQIERLSYTINVRVFLRPQISPFLCNHLNVDCFGCGNTSARYGVSLKRLWLVFPLSPSALWPLLFSFKATCWTLTPVLLLFRAEI